METSNDSVSVCIDVLVRHLVRAFFVAHVLDICRYAFLSSNEYSFIMTATGVPISRLWVSKFPERNRRAYFLIYIMTIGDRRTPTFRVFRPRVTMSKNWGEYGTVSRQGAHVCACIAPVDRIIRTSDFGKQTGYFTPMTEVLFLTKGHLFRKLENDYLVNEGVRHTTFPPIRDMAGWPRTDVYVC